MENWNVIVGSQKCVVDVEMIVDTVHGEDEMYSEECLHSKQ